MSELLIPMALDEEGRLHRAATAPREGRYFCPACGGPVLLRRGPIRVPHFAHRPDPAYPASAACRPETAIHRAAKLQIRQAIADWKAGRGPQPVIQRHCAVCQRKVHQPLPDDLEEAVLEYRLPDGFVVDVALMARGEVRAAVEIRVSHPVEEEKARRLPVPFVELDGHEVVEKPLEWRPIRERLRPYRCRLCRKIFRQFTTLAGQLAQRFGIALPDRIYRYGIARCYRCHKLTLVFAWPDPSPPPDQPADHPPVAHWSRVPPPEPRPPNVRRVYSRTLGERYWASACLACGALLGGWFLQAEPDGPFFRMLAAENALEDFELDLHRAAFQAAWTGVLGKSARLLAKKAEGGLEE